jgi:hypothetical protein
MKPVDSDSREKKRGRAPKVYSVHAPEVEFIGKGKARAPYEFGCKVSITTPARARLIRRDLSRRHRRRSTGKGFVAVVPAIRRRIASKLRPAGLRSPT